MRNEGFEVVSIFLTCKKLELFKAVTSGKRTHFDANIDRIL